MGTDRELVNERRPIRTERNVEGWIQELQRFGRRAGCERAVQQAPTAATQEQLAQAKQALAVVATRAKWAADVQTAALVVAEAEKIAQETPTAATQRQLAQAQQAYAAATERLQEPSCRCAPPRARRRCTSLHISGSVQTDQAEVASCPRPHPNARLRKSPWSRTPGSPPPTPGGLLDRSRPTSHRSRDPQPGAGVGAPRSARGRAAVNNRPSSVAGTQRPGFTGPVNCSGGESASSGERGTVVPVKGIARKALSQFGYHDPLPRGTSVPRRQKRQQLRVRVSFPR